MATLIMKNTKTGEVRRAPVGFSWTTFFFSGIPALLRGDMKNGAIMIGLALLTFGWSTIVFCFIYNKMFIRESLQTDYQVIASEGGDLQRISTQLGLELPLHADFQGGESAEALPAAA